MRKFTILILLMFVSFMQLWAQALLKGKVIDAVTNEPLPGVNVVIKGTTKGTITDFDGYFNIELSAGEKTLVFSFTGYESLEIDVTGKTTLVVSLKEKSTMVDEVVVIAYGTVKKSDLTGSVGSVKSADIVKITSSNPVQSLQGKVSGVNITSTSGAPGASPVVRIRGVGTFNNAAPIYIVDGVILNDISFLNSADIASMEILKDASATAMYGSRGANGVIIITTKSGNEKAEKPVIQFSAEAGMQKLVKKIDLLNGKEFGIIYNEIRPGTFNNVDALPNTDWQDLIFRTAPLQNYQFSINGSSKSAVYYFGVGAYSQDGIIPKSSYERLTIRTNNTYKLNNYIKLGNNFSINPYKQQNAPNVVYSAYRAQPLLKPYYDDGSFGVVYNVGNPLADLEYSNNFRKGVRGVGNIFAEVSFLNDFVFKSSYGIDAVYNKSVSFTPAYTIYNPDGTESQQNNPYSDLYKGTDDNLNWLWENTVTYNKSINKHGFNAVAGYTMQKSNSENMGISGQNIIRNGDDFWYIRPSYIIDQTIDLDMVNSIYNEVNNNLYYAMISYLFRANYSYDRRYTLTATFRRDGSSKFAKKNRYSNFPSFAFAWNACNEEFIKSIPLISTLKLRASWGIVGNEKIPYLNRFSMISSDLVAIFSNPDASFSAATFGKTGNPDLKWESTKQTDVGIEIGILNNRLTAEFDYYHKTTYDILIDLLTPGHLGNGAGQLITYNAASVLNTGIEYNISWREKRGEFSYNIGFIGSFIHNEAKAIGGNSGIDSVLLGGYLANGQPVTRSMVGLPIGAFYGYKTNGIFQNQAELDAYPHASLADVGDLRFVDINNDGKINGLDRTYIGSPIPKYTFGITAGVEYRNFDLSVDLQGQTGNKIFNGKDVVRPDPYNFEQHVWNRWRGEGTSTTEPRPSFGGYNYSPSDRFIQDGSFMRIRNIMLGYTIPAVVSQKMNISQCRIYVKATNLYTFTKYTGYTPEIGSESVTGNAIDNGVYPIPAIYSFGINLTF